MADNNGADQAPKKSKLKLIILLGLVVVLAVGLSIAGTLWFLKDQSDDSAPEAESDPAEEVFQPSQYFVLDKALVTTVQSQGRQRYVQVYLAFEAEDPAALAATELHLPLLRSQLINVLAGSDFMALQAAGSREQLAAEMLAMVNGVLAQEGAPALKGVLLRNFVMQ